MRRRYDFVNVADLNINLLEFFCFSLCTTSIKSNNYLSLLLQIVIAFFAQLRRNLLWEKNFYLILSLVNTILKN